MSTIIAVKVVPRAARDEVVGWHDGALKIRVTAAPEHGRANRAVVELLAATLKLKKTAVSITAGASSALKRVSIAGLEREHLLRLLERL
jgi:uncharacterized protein (TIGR00251 family)